MDLLRDESELLAIADAVAETTHAPRRLRPFRALAAVALAATAIFVLVLASPWDRGGGKGGVLDRALAAIDSSGPVVHMTIRLDVTRGGRIVPSVVTESFYDRREGLVRVVSRREGKVLGDYTTAAVEDEFSFFPGLLEGAAFYKQALANGQARIVGEGVWESRPVYWVELEKGGGVILRIGIDRDSYRPVVFRGLNPDGTPAGFQVAVLGFDYVSNAQAEFDNAASVLVTGRVVGPNCQPVKARVGAFLSDDAATENPHESAEVAAVRTGPNGSFTLKADPRKSPFREALSRSNGQLSFRLDAIAGKDVPKLIGFAGFSRAAKGGRWFEGAPVTIHASKGSAASHC
ncbi:MAG TPA: hypothetical protein VGJ40_08485 [Gaiellaceae bacterium]